MELLICIINREEKLDEVMAAWLQVGIRGATVLQSQGMGRILSKEVPAVAGLRSLLANARPQNVTVLAVVESGDQAASGIQAVQRVCGDLNAPSTGIAFSVPVSRVVGLAPEVDRNPTEGGSE